MWLPTRLNRSALVSLVAVVVAMAGWLHVASPTPALAQSGTRCEHAQPPGPNLTTTVGQRLVLVVESNRTTGYQWRLGQQPDARVLQLVGSEYVAPTGGAIGAGGLECWTFQAVGPGTTSLTLEYARPFEVGVAPARTESATVVVRPAGGAAIPSQLPRTGEATPPSAGGTLLLGLVAVALGLGCWRAARRV